MHEACQVHETLIKEAQQTQAREQLVRVIAANSDTGSLDEAIRHARSLDLGVECEELAAAIRRSAQVQIKNTSLSKDHVGLESAIMQGRSAGLDTSELAAASALLKEMRRDAARRSFGEAMRLRDRAQLEEAAELGRAALLDEEELSAMYEEFSMECVRYSREQLKQALDENDTNKIDKALDQASQHLEDEELLEARRKLVSLQLQDAASRVAGTPFRRIVDSLRHVVQQARVYRLGEERVADAEVVLRWAEENIQEEVCDICFEEHVTDTMPCCGRAAGGGRICSACLARTLESASVCPFCREHLN